MVIIWAVTFTAFLVLGFGTASVVLVAIPKSYSQYINYANVYSIEYLNENHSKPKELFDKREKNHDEPMKEMLNLLSKGGKTNALTNLFRGNPSTTIENNNSDTVYVSTFRNTYSKNAIIIWFKAPQYSVQNVTSTQFKLGNPINSTSNDVKNVYAIFIPLDNTENKFQQQTWFLTTTDRNKAYSINSLSMSNKITTHGNYHKLGNYVKDLCVLL